MPVSTNENVDAIIPYQLGILKIGYINLTCVSSLRAILCKLYGNFFSVKHSPCLDVGCIDVKV